MAAAMAFAALAAGLCLRAQVVAPGNSPASPAAAAPPAPRVSSAAGTPIDRVDAIVNGDLILDSDVDQEMRLEALEPYDEPSIASSRSEVLDRLINRALILQQAKLQNVDLVSDADVDRELAGLRRNIPECKKFDDCATAAGWNSFLQANGFTQQSLHALWKQRMQMLAYIEQRFKMGIRISQPEIADYYKTKMLPEYSAQHVAPPPLDSVSERIQEVLLEQHVTSLLDDWLKSLRAQGSVVVMHPGEAAP
jgi:peptidyl-prolyl cis-trans isomerase SurA